MAFSFFPNLVPRNVNPSWFQADRPCDEENELTQAEQEHQLWVSISTFKKKLHFFFNNSFFCFVLQLNQIATMDNDVLPIGKTSSEVI